MFLIKNHIRIHDFFVFFFFFYVERDVKDIERFDLFEFYA